MTKTQKVLGSIKLTFQESGKRLLKDTAISLIILSVGAGVLKFILDHLTYVFPYRTIFGILCLLKFTIFLLTIRIGSEKVAVDAETGEIVDSTNKEASQDTKFRIMERVMAAGKELSKEEFKAIEKEELVKTVLQLNGSMSKEVAEAFVESQLKK